MWQHSCAAGPRALASAIQVDRSSAVATLCGACADACTRLGPSRSGDVVAVAFAILANDELSRQSSHDAIELELLRMLAE